MATKTATFRIFFETADDTTEAASESYDVSFPLAGYAVKRTEDYQVAPAAADVAYTIPDACALLIYSLDYPFSLRLVSGQKLLTDVMCYLVAAGDSADQVIDVSVLFSGNGSNTANLKIAVLGQA